MIIYNSNYHPSTTTVHNTTPVISNLCLEPEKGKCLEHKHFQPNSQNTISLSTLCGGYNGVDFSEVGSNGVVPGYINLYGLTKPLDATYMFRGIRYPNGYFDENLHILTSRGTIKGQSYYPDSGESSLSSSPFALYAISSATGELSDLKGHYLRIEFDNTLPCKPRKVTVVPGFGPNKKFAKLL